MKTTKTKMIVGYMIILAIVGCASYRIRTFGEPDPEVEVVPLEVVLEDNDPHLRLGDMAICTGCGYTHNCQDWLELRQDTHYIIYGCLEANCFEDHNDLGKDIIDEIEDDQPVDQRILDKYNELALPPNPLPLKDIRRQPPQ